MQVKIPDLVYQTYDMLFGHEQSLVPIEKRTPDLAILMSFRVEYENFGYEKDGNTFHEEWKACAMFMVDVVVSARHNCYLAIRRDLRRQNKSSKRDDVTANSWLHPELFQNTSNHSSCWREDGLHDVTRLPWEAYDYCYGHVPEEHCPGVSSMHEFVFPGGFVGGPVFRLVRIRQEQDPANHNRKILKKIDLVETQLSF